MTNAPLLPRGIRNDNPGNIRFSVHQRWAGQVGCDDAGFCTFRSPDFGLRALRILLINYHVHDGCEKVKDYIARFAPPSENNTDEYLISVCARLGKSPETYLLIPDDLPSLMKAIITQENGVCPYTLKDMLTSQNYYPVMM